MAMIKEADKNYWKCNLALICASHYRVMLASPIQFLDGTNMHRSSSLTQNYCAQTTYTRIDCAMEGKEWPWTPMPGLFLLQLSHTLGANGFHGISIVRAPTFAN
jgi:hypothetical protein